jgi:hypothetical protein
VVPLLTPILFALVIAPALKQALHTSSAYESFVKPDDRDCSFR